MSPCEEVVFYFFSFRPLQTLLRCHSFGDVLSFSSRCQGNNGCGKAGACDTVEEWAAVEMQCQQEAGGRSSPTVQSLPQTGWGNLGNSNTMLQVFCCVSSRKKRANVIPIQTVLILVILLSHTYYLPPRVGKKKRKRTRGVKFQTQSLTPTLWCQWEGKRALNSLNYTQKLCFFCCCCRYFLIICQHFKLGSVDDLLKYKKTPRSSFNDLREILSIAECEAAQASHVCPIKIGNGPVCSALIRFLPAETAITFLSLGFSCGRAVLQTCHMHKAAHSF